MQSYSALFAMTLTQNSVLQPEEFFYPTFRRSDGNDWDFSKVPVIAIGKIVAVGR